MHESVQKTVKERLPGSLRDRGEDVVLTLHVSGRACYRIERDRHRLLEGRYLQMMDKVTNEVMLRH